MNGLQDKVILVIGAASGLGYADAEFKPGCEPVYGWILFPPGGQPYGAVAQIPAALLPKFFVRSI